MTFMILHLTFLGILRQFFPILQTFVKQGWPGKLLKKNHNFIRGSEDCNNESYFPERKHFSCKLTIQLLVKLCTLPLQHFIFLNYTFNHFLLKSIWLDFMRVLLPLYQFLTLDPVTCFDSFSVQCGLKIIITNLFQLYFDWLIIRSHINISI